MKQRILSAALSAALAAGLMSGEAFAAKTGTGPGAAGSVSTWVDGVEIRASAVEGSQYLFLPAAADLSALTLSVEGAEATLRCGKTTVQEGEALNLTAVEKDAEGRYAVKVTAGGRTKTLYVMQGSAIPTLYLTSEDPAEHGREWVDQSKSNKATGSMKLMDPDGTVLYDGGLTQIKPRGNSTFSYHPKKAYQIKLEEKTDLLGSGEKEKTWVLLANYGDATLMHDKLMKDLAAELGQPYVAHSDWVDVYYDGEYRGVYTLGEKNSVGGAGIDITDLEDAYAELNPAYGEDETYAETTNAYGNKILYTEGLAEPKNLTGGWLIELNLDFVDEVNGFYTTQGKGFNVKGPEFAGREAMEYISEYYQAFEDAVYARDEGGNNTGYNEKTGKHYYEYVDRDSLVLAFLLQEWACNPDGFKSSVYFYKDADGILHCGPIWDQDNTLGTGWGIRVSSGVTVYHYLQEALIRIPDFEAAVKAYFNETMAPALEKLLGDEGTFARTAALLADSAAMNYVLWPYVAVGNPETEDHLWAKGTDYAAVTKDLRSWAAHRLLVLQARYTLEERQPTVISTFPDTMDHWAESSIRYVVRQGVFNGKADGLFHPADSMTEAQMAVILHRMAGAPEAVPASGAWYATALSWTDAAGITDQRFSPEAAMTRGRLAEMLYRFAVAQGLDRTAKADLADFKDSAAVSAGLAPALEWAVGTGVVRGTADGTLSPERTASRAEVAVMIERFLKLEL